MEMNCEEVRAYIFELQPGDMTKYKFIISNNSDDVIIVGFNPTKFDGYTYHKESIERFFVENIVDQENYSQWVQDLNDSFIEYIEDHSNCTKYVAVAALICAKNLL
jgi:hypothetical protein